MSTLKNPIVQYIKDVIQFSIDEDTSILVAFTNHPWITYNNSTLEYKTPDHYSPNVGVNEALYLISPAVILYNFISTFSQISNLVYDAPLNYELQCNSTGEYGKVHDLAKNYNAGTINNLFSKNTSSFFNLMQGKFWEYPNLANGQIYNMGLSEFGTMDKDSCLKELTEYILTLPSLENGEGTLQFVLEAFMAYDGFASYTYDGDTVYAGTGQGFLNYW